MVRFCMGALVIELSLAKNNNQDAMRLRLTKVDEYKLLTCIQHSLWGSRVIPRYVLENDSSTST